MPIDAILRKDQHSFGPEEVKNIVQAFEGVLTTLRLTNREDPMALMIADTVFETAKQGETDPQRLRDIVVKKLSRS